MATAANCEFVLVLSGELDNMGNVFWRLRIGDESSRTHRSDGPTVQCRLVVRITRKNEIATKDRFERFDVDRHDEVSRDAGSVGRVEVGGQPNGLLCLLDSLSARAFLPWADGPVRPVKIPGDHVRSSVWS